MVPVNFARNDCEIGTREKSIVGEHWGLVADVLWPEL